MALNEGGSVASVGRALTITITRRTRIRIGRRL